MITSSIEAPANAWAQFTREVTCPPQTFWPEDFEGMTREIKEALRETDDLNARTYPHEKVMQAMQERIDRVRDKSC